MLKVAVIGGGSTYTPELLNGFIEQFQDFPISELWLMDIDETRLRIVGGFAQRRVAALGSPFKVRLTLDRKEALDGANYVITQFRVGQMAARREDEYLGQRHHLVGQETTGVGGMAMALRTIPVMLDIAKDIQFLAPNALLLNFTNPSGLITEALNIYAPGLSAVGVCNSAFTTKMAILNRLSQVHGEKYDADQTEILSLGLNHLSWNYGFKIDGRDVWPEVFDLYLEDLRKSENPEFDPNAISRLKMIPNSYLAYFYEEKRKIAEQGQWPPSRAEHVMVLEKELLDYYQDTAQINLPESLMKRGGAYYSTVATAILSAHYNNLGETHIVNVNHKGAVRGWEHDWVLEMPCRVDRSGIHPIPTEPLPLFNYILLEQVKRYELVTVEAAVHGDYQAALRGLITHPLGPVDEKAEEVLNDILETNRAYLPNFFR